MADQLKAATLRIGGKYNWKDQPERLIYMGMCEPRNGRWHQFALVETPTVVWCEVQPDDLDRLEVTQDRAKLVGVPAVQAGDGLQLVPAEPTDAMTFIGQSMRYDSANSIGAIYRAMLSAAPSQPVAGNELTDEQIVQIAKDCAEIDGRGNESFMHYEAPLILKFARALLASQPSAQPDGMENDLDWHKEALKRHSDKLASVWEGIADFVEKFTGNPCSNEPFNDLDAILKSSAQADVAAVRDALIEQCAVIAEDEDHRVDARGLYDQLGDARGTSSNIAEAIRALKSAAPTAQPQADGVKP